MTGPRPLLVAGVAGGVGTSTWVRIVRLAKGWQVQDLGVYRAEVAGGHVDVLVTANTAAATTRIGTVLATCPRPPVLVVMHTASGEVTGVRPNLRIVEPHLTARFDIDHRRSWLGMAGAPGDRLPTRAKDIEHAVGALSEALRTMLAVPAAWSLRRPPGPRPWAAPSVQARGGWPAEGPARRVPPPCGHPGIQRGGRRG